MSLANSIREGGFGDSGNIKVGRNIIFCFVNSFLLGLNPVAHAGEVSKDGPCSWRGAHLAQCRTSFHFHFQQHIWVASFSLGLNLTLLDWCVKDKATKVAHFGREFSRRCRDGVQVKAKVPDPARSLQVLSPSRSSSPFTPSGWRFERGGSGRSPKSLVGTSTSTTSSSTTSTMRSSRRTSPGCGAIWSLSRTFFGQLRTLGLCRFMGSATSPLAMSHSRTL